MLAVTSSIRAPAAVRAGRRAPAPARRHVSVSLRKTLICRAEPAPDAIETAVKQAEEACKDGQTGECAAAWDEVEEISAAIAHKKQAAAADPTSNDPLEKLCEEDPSADECRVYED